MAYIYKLSLVDILAKGVERIARGTCIFDEIDRRFFFRAALSGLYRLDVGSSSFEI